MAPKDRTSEFHSTLNSIKSRTVLPASTGSSKGVGGRSGSEARQPLIAKDASGAGSSAAGAAGKKSEFGRMAGVIAKDINSTTLKLQKLAQCEFLLAGECRRLESGC
jgi:syntaxin 5